MPSPNSRWLNCIKSMSFKTKKVKLVLRCNSKTRGKEKTIDQYSWTGGPQPCLILVLIKFKMNTKKKKYKYFYLGMCFPVLHSSNHSSFPYIWLILHFILLPNSWRLWICNHFSNQFTYEYRYKENDEMEGEKEDLNRHFILQGKTILKMLGGPKLIYRFFVPNKILRRIF